MASAVLAVSIPDVYTVLDARAWASLEMLGLEKMGLRAPQTSAQAHLDDCETYGAYLEACKRLATELQVSLRTLDRCLWALNGGPPSELLEKREEVI